MKFLEALSSYKEGQMIKRKQWDIRHPLCGISYKEVNANHLNMMITVMDVLADDWFVCDPDGER